MRPNAAPALRLALLAAAGASCALAAPQTTAVTGARLLPVDGPPIPEGVLLIEDGRIRAIGAVGELAVPSGSTVVDARGKVVMPGLVDTHSHLGGVGAADRSGPLQPGVRVYDSIDVRSSGFRRALAGGLTTLNLMPGSGHLCSGQTTYVKLRFHEGAPRTIDAVAYRFPDGSPMGGLKMANGTNSIREGGEGGFPGTRGKSAFLVRELFIRAREYGAKIAAATDEDGVVDPDERPPRDLHLETLLEVMDGKRVVHHHTHRHDDVLTVLRLAEEFGFRVVLHHVSEGWRVAEEIAAAGAPCSLILVDSPGGKLEAVHLVMETGAVLERAGARVAFHTDDWITDSRLFLRMAALGIRGGMSRGAALESVTLAGAEMLDLDERIGSLTPGKDADFVVLSGDPFSVYTQVEQTWVEGVKVFDRSDPDDLLHAEGGWGAADDVTPYLCCHDRASEGGSR
ncbi:MAG: amidohydrolase family protein [Planctomycetota bacterium]|jgi:imidazolonepropionase-like amidohydrolase|nr:amidohydrolase family protein [Planctomycetota bacterium]MDP6763004.1 amidohydrolase family protein [Planctomycetota bacterium]MDP6990713.1 amidohydrolase family protein [Planctomycetota bacterium]